MTLLGCLAFALPLGLYFGLPSCLWNFDGVACAIALELGSSYFVFHSNHLLYGFLGSLFWHFIGLPIGLSRALPALQFFTSLLSSGGLLGLYLLLRRQIRDPRLALGITWCGAVTAAFWVWSIEAQVYALGFLGLAWATYTLLEDRTPWKYAKVGLWHGLAVLGHVMHLLWLIPALYWIRQERPAADRRRDIRTYLTWLLASVAIPYLLVLVTVILPGPGKRGRLWIWLKGSAALTADRHWHWHSAGWVGPLIWCRTTVYALWGTGWTYGSTALGKTVWLLTGLSIVAWLLAFVLALRSDKNKQLRKWSLLWIAVYALFLWTWEPATLCYRMTEIIPLTLLIAMGLQELKEPFVRWGLLATLLGSTLTVNFITQAYPMSRANENILYQQTLALSKTTPDTSLYLTGGGITWIYLLYFTGRSAWNVHLVPAQRLSDEIARHRQGRTVFIQSELVQDQTMRPLLSVYKLKPIAPGLPWLQLEAG